MHSGYDTAAGGGDVDGGDVVAGHDDDGDCGHGDGDCDHGYGDRGRGCDYDHDCDYDYGRGGDDDYDGGRDYQICRTLGGKPHYCWCSRWPRYYPLGTTGGPGCASSGEHAAKTTSGKSCRETASRRCGYGCG